MGLDVYFIRKSIYKRAQDTSNNVIEKLSCLTNKNLITAIEDLYNHAVTNNLDFEECLSNAIIEYLKDNSNTYNEYEGNEVAYFRNLWWILNHFNYGDENYGKDVEITKSQVEELVSMSKKLILMVEEHFTDKGIEIDNSPLDYKGNTARFGGDRLKYLTFKNAVFTDVLVCEADGICSDALNSKDPYLFYKVCEIYIQFKEILETTDWDNQKIYLNADW